MKKKQKQMKITHKGIFVAVLFQRNPSALKRKYQEENVKTGVGGNLLKEGGTKSNILNTFS